MNGAKLSMNGVINRSGSLLEERRFFYYKTLLTILVCQNRFSSVQCVRPRLRFGYIRRLSLDFRPAERGRGCMKIKTNTIAMVCLGNAGAALAHALAENFPRSGYDVDPERRITVADLETA